MIFQDHTETIGGYLNWYKSSLQNTGIKEEQCNQSDKFSKYLVMAYWRKMDRQITHRFSLGLVYHLAQIMNKKDVALYDKFTMVVSQLPDSLHPAKIWALQLQLQQQFDQKILADILGSQIGEPDQEAVEKLLWACSDETGGSLYTCNTAKAFHNLLIWTLTTYARLLCEMKEYIVAEDWEAAGPHAGGFLGMAHLLNAIVHSAAFDEHMELLQQSQCLELPSLQCQADYLKFGGDKKWLNKHSRNGGEGNGDDEANEDGKDDQPEKQDQYSDSSFMEPSMVVSCWIKTFIKHFMAKHRLEAHCCMLHSHGHSRHSRV